MEEEEPKRAPPAEAEPGARPQIYVASLSDYNAGRLHGRWIDAATTDEELGEEVGAMLATVARIGRGIAEHGHAFAAWAAHVGNEPEALDGFDEAYLGRWESTEAYAEQMLDDLGATQILEGIPAWLQPHLQLDVAGFARDLELGGDIWTAPRPDGVDVFDGRT